MPFVSINLENQSVLRSQRYTANQPVRFASWVLRLEPQPELHAMLEALAGEATRQVDTLSYDTVEMLSAFINHVPINLTKSRLYDK